MGYLGRSLPIRLKSPRSASSGPLCPPHTEYQVSTAKSLPLLVPRSLGSLRGCGGPHHDHPVLPSRRTPAAVLPEEAEGLGAGQVMEVRGCEQRGCVPGSTDSGARSPQPVGAPTTPGHHELEVKLDEASHQSEYRTLPAWEEGLRARPQGHPQRALRRW